MDSLVDTHIIHKPSHHQNVPTSGWVFLTTIGILHRPVKEELRRFPAPFPNHRSSLRNEGITAGPELLLPHRSIPNRSGGDRQPYTVCMDIMSVHFEWNM